MLTPIKREVIDMVPVGMFLAYFEPIYGNHCNAGEHDDCLEHGCLDNGAEYVAEVEASVTQITAENYRDLPVDVTSRKVIDAKPLWEGDTHDLRPKLFETLRDAEKHVKATVERFKNPQPWECFVKTA